MYMQTEWKQLEAVLNILPQGLRDMVTDTQGLEEIRLRSNMPVQLIYAHGERQIDYRFSDSECESFLMEICSHSVYAHEEELKRGFISHNGCRIGLAGKAVLKNGAVERLLPITGFNIRIPGHLYGASKKVLKHFLNAEGNPVSTLIVSPPGVGKTPLLRGFAYCFSEGKSVARPHKIVIIDERNEIQGTGEGNAGFFVGSRTDTVSGCPKAVGMLMAIRSLSPEILITDEIGGDKDAEAILEAANCGITVLASVHGGSIAQIKRRPSIKRLMDNAAFERYAVIARNREGIYIKELCGGDLPLDYD